MSRPLSSTPFPYTTLFRSDDRDYALSTLRAACQAGARTLVLCDTNGGTMTNELVTIIGDVRTALEADSDAPPVTWGIHTQDRKSTRLNSSHLVISYAVFCL